MTRLFLLPASAVLCILAILPALAADAPATAPAVDRSTPEKALQTYFRALQAGDFKVLNDSITLTDAKWAKLLEADLKYRLWQRYVERVAIEKYGKDEGIKVCSNVRSFEDRWTLDIQRAEYANVDLDKNDKTLAAVYLKPEKNPIAGEEPRSTWYMKQVGKDWKVDYIKVFDWNNPDQADQLKTNAAYYPRVSVKLKEIAEQIKKGTLPTADDAKSAVEAAWNIDDTTTTQKSQ